MLRKALSKLKSSQALLNTWAIEFCWTLNYPSPYKVKSGAPKPSNTHL
jgi:hypothetical protein